MPYHNNIKHNIIRPLWVLMLLTVSVATSFSMSFNLDSISEMGRFPRFIVNTYRWGDRFFNGYDTTYVQGTGYKFNIKLVADSWLDSYNFQLPENKRIDMYSTPVTQTGLYLSYLAVTVGYDINLSKLFTGVDRSRQRFRFGFSCMLFTADLYYSKNDIGAKIRKIVDGDKVIRPDYPFHDINNTQWGLDVYYYFNHKKYSEAASFNLSRLQRKSQGSFLAGFAIYTQNLNFDFSTLPPSYRNLLPSDWKPLYHYIVNTHNYGIRVGYGHNWVLPRNWVLAVSVSPIIGIRNGWVTPWDDGTERKLSLSMFTTGKTGVVWNSGPWFVGASIKADGAIINNKKTTYVGGVINGTALFGYRFNLW